MNLARRGFPPQAPKGYDAIPYRFAMVRPENGEDDREGNLHNHSRINFFSGFRLQTETIFTYFDIASITLFMISSLRFFIPNQTTIAIEAPSPIPIPQKIGVMIV